MNTNTVKLSLLAVVVMAATAPAHSGVLIDANGLNNKLGFNERGQAGSETEVASRWILEKIASDKGVTVEQLVLSDGASSYNPDPSQASYEVDHVLYHERNLVVSALNDWNNTYADPAHPLSFTNPYAVKPADASQNPHAVNPDQKTQRTETYSANVSVPGTITRDYIAAFSITQAKIDGNAAGAKLAAAHALQAQTTALAIADSASHADVQHYERTQGTVQTFATKEDTAATAAAIKNGINWNTSNDIAAVKWRASVIKNIAPGLDDSFYLKAAHNDAYSSAQTILVNGATQKLQDLYSAATNPAQLVMQQFNQSRTADQKPDGKSDAAKNAALSAANVAGAAHTAQMVVDVDVSAPAPVATFTTPDPIYTMAPGNTTTIAKTPSLNLPTQQAPAVPVVASGKGIKGQPRQDAKTAQADANQEQIKSGAQSVLSPVDTGKGTTQAHTTQLTDMQKQLRSQDDLFMKKVNGQSIRAKAAAKSAAKDATLTREANDHHHATVSNDSSLIDNVVVSTLNPVILVQDVKPTAADVSTTSKQAGADSDSFPADTGSTPVAQVNTVKPNNVTLSPVADDDSMIDNVVTVTNTPVILPLNNTPATAGGVVTTGKTAGMGSDATPVAPVSTPVAQVNTVKTNNVTLSPVADDSSLIDNVVTVTNTPVIMPLNNAPAVAATVATSAKSAGTDSDTTPNTTASTPVAQANVPNGVNNTLQTRLGQTVSLKSKQQFNHDVMADVVSHKLPTMTKTQKDANQAQAIANAQNQLSLVKPTQFVDNTLTAAPVPYSAPVPVQKVTVTAEPTKAPNAAPVAAPVVKFVDNTGSITAAPAPINQAAPVAPKQVTVTVDNTGALTAAPAPVGTPTSVQKVTVSAVPTKAPYAAPQVDGKALAAALAKRNDTSTALKLAQNVQHAYDIAQQHKVLADYDLRHANNLNPGKGNTPATVAAQNVVTKGQNKLVQNVTITTPAGSAGLPDNTVINPQTDNDSHTTVIQKDVVKPPMYVAQAPQAPVTKTPAPLPQQQTPAAPKTVTATNLTKTPVTQIVHKSTLLTAAPFQKAAPTKIETVKKTEVDVTGLTDANKARTANQVATYTGDSRHPTNEHHQEKNTVPATALTPASKPAAQVKPVAQQHMLQTPVQQPVTQQQQTTVPVQPTMTAPQTVGSYYNQQQVNQTVSRSSASTLKQANSYTNEKFNQLKGEVEDNRKSANAGTASAIAFASQPQVKTGDTFMVSAGAGEYNGQSAVSVGASFNAGENTVIKMGVTADTQSNVGAGLGIGVSY